MGTHPPGRAVGGSRDRAGGDERERPPGIAGLSLPSQVMAAVVLTLAVSVAVVHMAMVFLHVAPANTATKQHGQVVEDWIYPEFEQNWKLFAPNPLQQNIAVQARAELRNPDGTLHTSGWTDLSAQDGAAIDGNLLPSHTRQNELRRAWDVYTSTHDSDDEPVNGLRSELSQRYIHRIALMRLAAGEPADHGRIERVQLRSKTTNVQPPTWSDEQLDDKPEYRQLPWWLVTEQDRGLAR